ncbi:MAG: tRNA (guanine(9)-N(1))-methyltransferase [Vezdaea acicularis]|nr:MAG: tRNA (guanine(9)-N(1))-methyltransferase [Vezdaea acicularis]
MEAEERPRKIVKLTHDLGSTAEVPKPLDTLPDEDIAVVDKDHKAPSSAFENIELHQPIVEIIDGHKEPDDPGKHNESDFTGDLAGLTSNDAPVDDTSTDPVSTETPLSKNQLKKLKRHEDWEAGRVWRKAKRKEKINAKRQRKREAKSAFRAEQAGGKDQDSSKPPSEVTGATSHDFPPARRGAKQPHHARATQVPIAFVLDCAYDEFMTEKELISLSTQLTRCYSDNKNAKLRAHLVVCAWGGKLRERFDGVLARNHEGWRGVRFLEEGVSDVAEMAGKEGRWMRGKGGGEVVGALASVPATGKGANEEGGPERNGEDREGEDRDEGDEDSSKGKEVGRDRGDENKHRNRTNIAEAAPQDDVPQHDGETIYLTSDSPHTLHTLRPYSTYIIGALVDRNRHKGLCYKTALSQGLKTAKLPIADYLQMSSRFVLATNHVLEIMLKWLEFGDWGRAFVEVVPKRKGGVLREAGVGERRAAFVQVVAKKKGEVLWGREVGEKEEEWSEGTGGGSRDGEDDEDEDEEEERPTN